MPESLNLKSLAPSPPPYPPLPRFIFEGSSSPPELPKIPKEAEEAEDIVFERLPDDERSPLDNADKT